MYIFPQILFLSCCFLSFSLNLTSSCISGAAQNDVYWLTPNLVIVPLSFYIGSRALYNILTTTLIAKNFDAKNFDAKNFDAKNFDAKNFDAKNFDAKNFDAKNFDAKNFDAKNFDAKNFDAKNLGFF